MDFGPVTTHFTPVAEEALSGQFPWPRTNWSRQRASRSASMVSMGSCKFTTYYGPLLPATRPGMTGAGQEKGGKWGREMSWVHGCNLEAEGTFGGVLSKLSCDYHVTRTATVVL